MTSDEIRLLSQSLALNVNAIVTACWQRQEKIAVQLAQVMADQIVQLGKEALKGKE